MKKLGDLPEVDSVDVITLQFNYNCPNCSAVVGGQLDSLGTTRRCGLCAEDHELPNGVLVVGSGPVPELQTVHPNTASAEVQIATLEALDGGRDYSEAEFFVADHLNQLGAKTVNDDATVYAVTLFQVIQLLRDHQCPSFVDGAKPLDPDKTGVSTRALAQVLDALVGQPYRLRELLATASPASLFPDNPINVLLSDFANRNKKAE